MSGKLKPEGGRYPFRVYPKPIKKSEKEDPEKGTTRPKPPPSYGVFKQI